MDNLLWVRSLRHAKVATLKNRPKQPTGVVDAEELSQNEEAS